MPSNARSSSPPPDEDGFLHPFSRPPVAVGLFAATLGLVALFNLFPAIDRAASAWFFEAAPCPPDAAADVCGHFPAATDPVLNAVRDFFHYLPPALAVLLLIAALAASIRRVAAHRRFALGIFVALASIVLCSLVIVNVWLKSFSGRPRPWQTDLFGGDMPFVPAGRFSDHCASNCSFVSGESSAAFWLICLAALAPRRWRPAAFALTGAIAVWVAGLRVAFGAHYLSDVAIAGLLSLATFAALATLAARIGMAGARPRASTFR